jgi:NAD(P)-dependent dehydrogenase (short-subunit alcohol dehydrogenase family)
MYASTPVEFQAAFRSWHENTPLAAVREEVDTPEQVKNGELAGGRPAYVAEIAGTVAMLCTPEVGWTTGSVISANGGLKFSY